MSTLTFGKYKGTDVKDIPTDYLEWGVAKLDSPKWKKEFQTELNRRKQETKTLLKNNPDKLLKKLEKEALKDIQQEIANSGSEHEYTQFDEFGEAENRAKTKLAAMQASKDLENLKIEYANLLGVDLAMMDKLEDAYYNEQLSRSNFQYERKYNLAMEYFEKKDKLLEIVMTRSF